ncbi:ATP-binding protein [Sphingomonas abietis]|uniref:DUF853 family protein n=1 Tax=Sphingomonas abietis TaxID=3012344 RepID=A0ABY7NI86_9SPHN|nr:helicase HerA-like domain-containing protein [Sphingomonas abietis]WBO20987.1 DUF853 family protein [Sphingomonas abietis]
MSSIKALPLPDKALEDCGAILGRRGAGKSATGRVLLEHELLAEHRCCVIDPKGDWFGIRLNADGSPSPWQIPVFGGQRGDVALTDDMGAAIARLVAGHHMSCVVDLSELSVAGMRRFMSAFAETLFQLNRRALTLFVDEADQLAPQRVGADQGKLLHHMESLIRQGRQRGISMWMLTQRPQVLNKNLLSQAETLIAMKMTTPHDRKAIRDWMEAHDPEKAAEVMDTLADLKVGEAWAWVPAADFLERVQFPLFATYDSGRAPKHGEKVADAELPPIEIGELAAALGIEDVEDPRDEELERLRAENGRLRSSLAAERARAARYEAQGNVWLEVMAELRGRIGAAIGSPEIVPLPPEARYQDYDMRLEGDGIIRPVPREPDSGPLVVDARRRVAAAPPVAAPKTKTDLRAAIAAAGVTPSNGHLEGLPPAQRRIVVAIASAKGEPMPKAQIADLAGVSPTSSHMGVGLKRLAERGLIMAVGEGFAATAASLPQGIAHA